MDGHKQILESERIVIGICMKNSLQLIIIIILQFLLSTYCKKEQIPPEITINSSVLTVAEDDPLASIDIPIKLSESYDEAVSLNYITADSTAIAGADYTAVISGILTFQPGETLKSINVSILSDTAQKQDVFFEVVLSNPVNGVLTKTSVTIKIINVDYANIVWSDEFNSGIKLMQEDFI